MITVLDLKKDKMMALKAHDVNKQNILGVVIAAYQKAEIDKKGAGQEMTDADMVAVLNHTLKELEDEKAMYVTGNRPEEVKATEAQIAIVKGYLPQMMTEEEIRAAIAKLPDHSIKSIMVAFKTDYAGKADMGLVSKIAKTYQA
ncbi:MAG: GatB/YqeY domain-containing protein [Bacilli bacterium]|jgi:uncharacterized protein YqeY|nr:GatB/YqeY domain-containing protein [Bacilli bacterium]